MQPRIAAGSSSFTEVPTGMLHDAGIFAGGSAMEIEAKNGLRVQARGFLDMTTLTLAGEKSEGQLQKRIFSTLVGCGEYIPMFLC